MIFGYLAMFSDGLKLQNHKTLAVSYLVKLRKTRRPFINLHLCEMHFEIDQPNQICRNLITFAIMLLTLNTKPHLANT